MTLDYRERECWAGNLPHVERIPIGPDDVALASTLTASNLCPLAPLSYGQILESLVFRPRSIEVREVNVALREQFQHQHPSVVAASARRWYARQKRTPGGRAWLRAASRRRYLRRKAAR